MVSLKKLMVWPLCLLLGFSLYLSGSGDVLCFGDSGHVEIEAVHLHSCCDSEHSTSVPASDHPDHDCASCSDIPLGSPQMWHRSRLTDEPIMTSVTIHQTISFDCECSVADGSVGYARALACGERPAAICETTTTVLRC